MSDFFNFSAMSTWKKESERKKWARMALPSGLQVSYRPQTPFT
jgi:hypothetical protein